MVPSSALALVILSPFESGTATTRLRRVYLELGLRSERGPGALFEFTYPCVEKPEPSERKTWSAANPQHAYSNCNVKCLAIAAEPF